MTWMSGLLQRPTIGWWDLLDILIVSLVIYEVLKLIRGTRAVQMLTGIVVLAGSNNFATGSTIGLGGGSNVGGGILRLANNNALGSNSVTLNTTGGNSNWVGAVELSGAPKAIAGA